MVASRAKAGNDAATGRAARGRDREAGVTVLAALWCVAMLALVGVFLGGAGLLIFVSGRWTVDVATLIVIGLVSTGYLLWFLGVGPARLPSPSTRPHPQVQPLSGPTEGLPLIATPRPVRCSGCGIGHTEGNRLIEARSATLCERCVTEAVIRVSPSWFAGPSEWGEAPHRLS